MELILASKSPRRKEILQKMGYKFKIIPSTKDEVVDKNLLPVQVVLQLALNKANEVFESNRDCVVLGSDTIVCIDGEILGKPNGDSGELEMLNKLSNREHYVYTGYAVVSNDRVVCGTCKSTVVFNDLTNEQKLAYVKSKLGLDKAGGYGIQDEYNLVKQYKGSYYNIMGLPLEDLEPILKQFSID